MLIDKGVTNADRTVSRIKELVCAGQMPQHIHDRKRKYICTRKFFTGRSVFSHYGVHQYPAYDLTDEVFTGTVVSMAVPPAVIDLSERIDEWNNKYVELVSSPYNSMSESFGDYSRSWSKGGSGQGNANSSSTPTWQTMFANELNRWRKI